MSDKKFIEEIKELQSVNDEESNKKIIDLARKKLLPELSKEDREDIEKIIVMSEINLLKIKVENLAPTDEKEKIKLNGRLIKKYKKLAKVETDPNKQMEIRHQSLKLLEEQREQTKDYRKSNNEIKLPEKIALKVKEIASSIKIFLEKKDVITKIKNVFGDTIKGTGSSLLLITAIGLAAQAITGIPFSLASIVQALPVASYVGLSSIIRNISKKTPFQEYEYIESDEYKAAVEQFNENNKDAINELTKIINEKESMTSSEERIEINKIIVDKIKEIMKNTKLPTVRQNFDLEILGILRENKDLCKQITSGFLNEDNNDTKKYIEYNKELLKTNLQIYKQENSLGTAIKKSGKEVVENSAIITIAKALIKLISPNSPYALNGPQSLIIPIAFAIINGIINIPTYTDKLKYKEVSKNTKVDVEEKAKIIDLFKDDYELSLAA